MYKLKEISIDIKGNSVLDNSIADVSSIDAYMKSCIGSKLNYLTLNLLNQGGYLFRDDAYILDKADYQIIINSKTYSLAIDSEVPFLYDVSLNYEPFPPVNYLFGFNQFKIGDGLFNYNDFSSHPFFGTVEIPPLCNINGSNKPDSYISCSPSLYNYGDFDLNKTIQYQLEYLLPLKIKECIYTIPSSFGFNIESSEYSYFDLLLMDDSVKINSDLKLTYLEKSNVNEIDVNYEFPLRLKHLYSFVNDILNFETKDFLFYFKSDSSKSQYFDPYFKVSLDKLNDNYSLLTVTDLKNKLLVSSDNSSFHDLPYLSYKGLIKNRRSYLDYIPDVRVSGRDYSGSAVYDYQRAGNFVIKIYDPDDLDYYNLSNILVDVSKKEGGTDEGVSYFESILLDNLNFVDDDEFKDLSSDKLGEIESYDNIKLFNYSFIASCKNSNHCKLEGSEYSDAFYLVNFTLKNSDNQDFQEAGLKIFS